MFRKFFTILIVSIILLIAMVALCLGAFMPRTIFEGPVISWEKIPVPQDRFEMWQFDHGRLSATTGYRQDFYRLTGRSSMQSFSEFIRKNEDDASLHVKGYDDISSDNKAALDHFNLPPDAIKSLKSRKAWYVDAAFDGLTYMVIEYDPVSEFFLATIYVYHGEKLQAWKQRHIAETMLENSGGK